MTQTLDWKTTFYILLIASIIFYSMMFLTSLYKESITITELPPETLKGVMIP